VTIALLGLLTIAAPAVAAQGTPRLIINDITVLEPKGALSGGVARFTVSFADATPHGNVTVTVVPTFAGTAAGGNGCSVFVDFIRRDSTITIGATQNGRVYMSRSAATDRMRTTKRSR
jgi:hypothetical protein